MPAICKACQFWDRQPNTILLPDGTEIVQQGEILNAGGTGKTIAKCTNLSNFWENITRALITDSFFNDAQKKLLLNYVGSIATAEDDTCPLYSDRLVASIVVTSTGDAIYCDNGGTLQMLNDILPVDAVDTSYTWSIIAGTGTATIDGGGLMTGTGLGTVTARCTANDAGAVYGELEITIIDFVTAITVSGFGGATSVASGATLQMLAAILPLGATIQAVNWTVTNGTGSAAIDSFGLLTGGSVGTVTVTATAVDGSLIYDDFVLNII